MAFNWGKAFQGAAMGALQGYSSIQQGQMEKEWEIEKQRIAEEREKSLYLWKRQQELNDPEYTRKKEMEEATFAQQQTTFKQSQMSPITVVNTDTGERQTTTLADLDSLGPGWRPLTKLEEQEESVRAASRLTSEEEDRKLEKAMNAINNLPDVDDATKKFMIADLQSGGLLSETLKNKAALEKSKKGDGGEKGILTDGQYVNYIADTTKSLFENPEYFPNLSPEERMARATADAIKQSDLVIQAMNLAKGQQVTGINEDILKANKGDPDAKARLAGLSDAMMRASSRESGTALVEEPKNEREKYRQSPAFQSLLANYSRTGAVIDEEDILTKFIQNQKTKLGLKEERQEEVSSRMRRNIEAAGGVPTPGQR
ncbi:MAG: hypothetical protein WC961_07730 [Anaerovoracaceae bacterium]|jgi:hypothetical protein